MSLIGRPRKAFDVIAYNAQKSGAQDKRYKLLLAAFTELQAAAQKVVDETDRIFGSEPPPVKYRAPYGAIVELRQLLAKQYGLRW